MNGDRGRLLTVVGIEVLIFGLAAVVHRGVFASGYEHAKASIAETVIAVVLAMGLVACVIRPAMTRIAALAAQVFALLGVCVGVVMIAIGVGPRTGPDVALHGLMFVVLAYGILCVLRMRASVRQERP